MQSIRLSDRRSQSVTLLPDSFIEDAMPGANGDFVKIYIYLLSSMHHPERELSLPSIADVFSCTEKDVLRALHYWAQEGYLSLEMDGGQPTGLTFCEPSSTCKGNPEEEKTTDTASPSPSTAEKEAEKEPVSFSLSADRIRSLKAENEEAQQILYVAQSYLNRPLNRSEITCILYFYDTLHMSADLVEYLIEYCVLHQKTSIHYIQKVGLEWHRAGYTTVKEAKEGSSSIRKEYYTILKAFGVNNRRPIPAEIEYMDRWMNTYGFDLPVIQEACKRTVTNTGGSSFAYAEGILANWKKQKVHTLQDVLEEDNRYQAEKKKKHTGEKENASKASANRFHNFHQRDDYDYDQLEKDLLKNQW